ncbi:MRG/MORF4L-binding protein isoform X2 [Anabrus simplex]
MACIVEKFRNFANKDVTSKPLWEHLETMYDMQSLDDIENLPFPNEERDFCLPEEEFGNLIQERTKSEKRQVETSEEEPPSVSNKPIKEVNVKMSPAKKEVNKEAKKSGNKESKETKKDVKGRDVPKEGKKDSVETKEPKTPKQRTGAKEKEEEAAAVRKKESADAKRGAKRVARGGNKSDDASSSQSSSPVATPTPLPPLPSQKRRRV